MQPWQINDFTKKENETLDLVTRHGSNQAPSPTLSQGGALTSISQMEGLLPRAFPSSEGQGLPPGFRDLRGVHTPPASTSASQRDNWSTNVMREGELRALKMRLFLYLIQCGNAML